MSVGNGANGSGSGFQSVGDLNSNGREGQEHDLGFDAWMVVYFAEGSKHTLSLSLSLVGWLSVLQACTLDIVISARCVAIILP